MKKKILISLIAICTMLFAFGIINASAESSGTCGTNLTWTLNGDTLTISGQGTMTNWTNNLKVPWYSLKEDIVKIVIADGVTTIGDRAFGFCSSLVSITIPDGVTSIGEDAFSDCSSLASITIPDSVTSIGDCAFSDCSSLINITLPNGVKSIGDFVFSGCSSLASITIPDSVTRIGNRAFYECRRITSVTIPDSVKSIGYGAFECCSSLSSVTIPDSVTSIGQDAFEFCSSLKNVNITDLEAWCNISFVNFASNPLYYAGRLYLNDNLVTDIIIPDGVTSIGDYSFYNCSSLVSIIIPNSVTNIGEEAFSNCNGLVSITIPDGVTNIGEGAFRNCNNLKFVCLPQGIQYIKNDAFNGCTNIETVFYFGSETQWNEILFYSRNESLTNAKIVYNAIQKTYKFETNCDTKLADITDYAIFTMPIVENNGMTLSGWYDNASLSGEPITFPYYGDTTTLYAAWTDRTGKSFDNAFIVKPNQEYTVTTTESGQLVYFEFVPKFSKEYRFYTTGSKDTYGYLYNSNQSRLTSNDDDGDGNNFYISYKLTAGQTYYIAAKLYSGTGIFTFVVEEPVDYRINEITIKDMSGNNLQTIPLGHFLATVSFTNVSSSADTVIILAQYTNAGAFKGLMYIQTEDVPTGSTIKLSIPVDNSNGDVAELKAFCWESFGSLTPMGNSASFPAEQ